MWTEIAYAIKRLESNNDIECKTHENYIIGYICHRLAPHITIEKKLDRLMPSASSLDDIYKERNS